MIHNFCKLSSKNRLKAKIKQSFQASILMKLLTMKLKMQKISKASASCIKKFITIFSLKINQSLRKININKI
jgi:hypothetical protein